MNSVYSIYLTTSIQCVKRDYLCTICFFVLFFKCFLQSSSEKQLKEMGSAHVVLFIHPFNVFKYMYIYISLSLYIVCHILALILIQPSYRQFASTFSTGSFVYIYIYVYNIHMYVYIFVCIYL